MKDDPSRYLLRQLKGYVADVRPTGPELLAILAAHLGEDEHADWTLLKSLLPLYTKQHRSAEEQVVRLLERRIVSTAERRQWCDSPSRDVDWLATRVERRATGLVRYANTADLAHYDAVVAGALAGVARGWCMALRHYAQVPDASARAARLAAAATRAGVRPRPWDRNAVRAVRGVDADLCAAVIACRNLWSRMQPDTVVQAVEAWIGTADQPGMAASSITRRDPMLFEQASTLNVLRALHACGWCVDKQRWQDEPGLQSMRCRGTPLLLYVSKGSLRDADGRIIEQASVSDGLRDLVEATGTPAALSRPDIVLTFADPETRRTCTWIADAKYTTGRTYVRPSIAAMVGYLRAWGEHIPQHTPRATLMFWSSITRVLGVDLTASPPPDNEASDVVQAMRAPGQGRQGGEAVPDVLCLRRDVMESRDGTVHPVVKAWAERLTDLAHATLRAPAVATSTPNQPVAP